MAPRLAKSQFTLVTDMLSSGYFTNSEIATAANCSARAVCEGYIQMFDTTAPPKPLKTAEDESEASRRLC
jgi:hypothetical protein